jgi:hypothetical protein
MEKKVCIKKKYPIREIASTIVRSETQAQHFTVNTVGWGRAFAYIIYCNEYGRWSVVEMIDIVIKTKQLLI